MKVVLFCGGQGLRMRDPANDIPKPLMPLGSRPLLWHVMKYYAHWGHTDFILCLGYKGVAIKEYFVRYQEWISNDFVLSGGARDLHLLRRDVEDWRITFVDTGADTTIGERLMAVRHLVEREPIFFANYSDGLSDCPLPTLVDRLHETDATAVCMTARSHLSFHVVHHNAAGLVTAIAGAEDANSWVNAGYFALRPEIFDYIRPGEELVEQPFARLIEERRLATLPYSGFWRCCDTFKDLQILESLLARGPAPWEVWRHAPAQRPQPFALTVPVQMRARAPVG